MTEHIIGFKKETIKATIEQNKFDTKLHGTTMGRVANILESFLGPNYTIPVNWGKVVSVVQENYAEPHKCPFGCDVSSGLDTVITIEGDIVIRFNTLHIHTMRQHCFAGEPGFYKVEISLIICMFTPYKHKISWHTGSNYSKVHYHSACYLAVYQKSSVNSHYYKVGEIIPQNSVPWQNIIDFGMIRIEVVGNKMYNLLMWKPETIPCYDGIDKYLTTCIGTENITIEDLKEELKQVELLVEQKNYIELFKIAHLVMHSPEERKWLIGSIFGYPIVVWPLGWSYRLSENYKC